MSPSIDNEEAKAVTAGLPEHGEGVKEGQAGKRRLEADVSTPPAPKAIKTANLIDFDATEKTWTPEDTRTSRDTKKVRGVEDGAFRGGDFIMNINGNATTVSFCFKVGDDWYGVTAGHLAAMDEPLFVFVGINDGHKVRQIGKVVSHSFATDSLVFSIDVNQTGHGVSSRLLAEKSGLGGKAFTFPISSSVEMGTQLIGFSAVRRGAIGKVTVPSLKAGDGIVLAGDIGIEGMHDCRRLTTLGDCGTVFVDKEGTGLYMHHASRQPTGKDEWTSFGVPLKNVLAAHSLLGGEDEVKPPTTSVKESTPNKLAYVYSRDILNLEDLEFEGEYQVSHDIGRPMKLEFETAF